MSIFDSTSLSAAAMDAGSPSAEAVNARSNIFGMTQAAEDAVLRPREAGAWPHELRAALAARLARLNGEVALAARYGEDAGDFAPLADVETSGEAQGLEDVVAFMDKVAADTRDIGADDIACLQAAGISDADIVRLAELNAFLAYQVRVVAGLRLMKEAAR